MTTEKNGFPLFSQWAELHVGMWVKYVGKVDVGVKYLFHP